MKPTRRLVTPQVRAFVERVVAQINAYSDPFGQVSSWSMFERASDSPADMQVAARILEHLPDANAAIAELVKLARKAVVCIIELGDGRTVDDWRKLLDRHIRIARVDEGINSILVIGSPKVVVDGVAVVGALGLDEQWKQVEANLAAVEGRIEAVPAHDRRAILACYGPSLVEMMIPLRRLAEAGGDVVSISGAHDMLLERGIVPKYHVECDPRPHKADNIEKAHPDVVYLLASAVHPAVIEKVRRGGGQMRLWHVGAGDHTMKLIDGKGEKRGTVVGGGSSVGLRAIPLLYALGYRDLAIFAMDCSFADDGRQWAGKHSGKLKKAVSVKCGDRIFMTSPVLLGYATQFFETVQKVDGIEYELFGDGLLQEMTRLYMMDALEAA